MRLFSRLLARLPRDFSNFPERYIKRQTQFIDYKPPAGLPNYWSKPVRWRDEPYYDVHRPWTREFQEQNAPGVEQPEIFVQPLRKFPVLRGDIVEILSGKDKGKQGIVDYIVKERNWVFVEGLNVRHTWTNKDADNPGYIVSETMPLLYPIDVCFVDPTDKRPTEAEWRLDEDGNQVRVSLRTERVIPIPNEAYHTYDYKMKTEYVEEAKDTPATEVEKITFVAKAKTFEMDIMDQMGMKEERIPYPMFWY